MDEQAFRSAYNQPRNGTDNYYRHALVPSFIYTDGVRDCAIAGCYWLLDMVATEVKEALHKEAEKQEGYIGTTYLVVTVTGSKAHIDLLANISDTLIAGRRQFKELTVVYEVDVPYTDMPEGEWCFILAAQDAATLKNISTCPVVMCLLSED